jgi:hypothetical protein
MATLFWLGAIAHIIIIFWSAKLTVKSAGSDHIVTPDPVYILPAHPPNGIMSTSEGHTADYYRISDEFGIDGTLTDGELALLKSEYASILYLCTDSPTDSGLVCYSNFMMILYKCL